MSSGLVEQRPELVAVQPRVAEDFTEKARPNRVASVNRDEGRPAVGVA